MLLAKPSVLALTNQTPLAHHPLSSLSSQSMLELLGETPVAAASRAFPQPGQQYTPSETDAIMAHKFTEVSRVADRRCSSVCCVPIGSSLW